MDFIAFKKRVEKVKSEHPVWFGLDADQQASDETINDVEGRLDIKLPSDYKDFVREYGGGYFAFGVVYSLDSSSEWYLVNINGLSNELGNGYLLISENGSGDFYGYRVVDRACASEIYFYDHEETSWRQAGFDNIFDYLSKYALTN